jgi:hypothetical protein
MKLINYNIFYYLFLGSLFLAKYLIKLNINFIKFDSYLIMCSLNCYVKDLTDRTYIEYIAKRVFDNEMDNSRKDIYSLLKTYIKYDSDLVTFRNMSIDNYTKTINKETKLHIVNTTNLINNIIDNKINELKDKSPVDIIVTSTLKQIEPKMSRTNYFATTGVALGVVNLIGLAYLISK